jgi:acyl-CoA hydrolase/RimJ/RimL family protein N-acetyltransferase
LIFKSFSSPKQREPAWKNRVVGPDDVLEKIEPGMSIFLGTGMAEPRTLVKHLMASAQPNLQDLEVIQLVSLGDAVAIDERFSKKYRLKTFFSGWVAGEAIQEGRVDLIPSRFSRIPWLFRTGAINIDVAFIQITPPDETGYCTLGLGMAVERQAMESAKVVVGEINAAAPRTLGDTVVHIDEFDYLIEALEPIFYVPRWPLPEVYLKIAGHIATIVEDGSCISFAIGPLYEALGQQLVNKKHLGIQSPFFTDALMDLVKSGAVTNRSKGVFRGKSAASYIMGTKELLAWLDRNPLVEFQPIDVIMNPKVIGRNDRVMAILPARKVDLTGNVALHMGKGNVTSGPGAVQELFMGAAMSRNGRTVFALPSRNRQGEGNIVLSVENMPYQFSNRESLDIVVTEYGVAYLMGRTLRQRAQALIDVAHPDDRAALVQQAKDAKMIYADQIYFADSGHLYPEKVACTHTFKDSLAVRFRAIKPSDEDEMRQLFYRFSDQAVYYRYFSPIKAMPHKKMQEYVTVDYRRIMSVVGVIEEAGTEKIIAEARYVRSPDRPYADTAFIVDEAYQGKGVASFLLELLVKIAREEGVEGFTADVLTVNKAMLRVYEKSGFPIKAVLAAGAYELIIPFQDKAQEMGKEGTD